MDGHAALCLLALSCAAGTARSALRSALVDGADPVDLCYDDRFAPGPAEWRRAERQLRAARALGIDLVPLWELPPRLRAARPPPLLFVRGDASLLGKRAVAVVGSRQASEGPMRWAAGVARSAARAGLTVVSGGALGVDGAAHRGALVEGGATVAFLGTAADSLYPPAHRSLFERILLAGGALASEHAPGESTWAAAHAQRNRFIAAMAEQVYIAEAAAGSGSLGTAKWARRLGRPIYVPPDSVGGQRDGLRSLLIDGQAAILGAG